MKKYDRDGREMSLVEWASAFEAGNAVAKTTVGGLDVSTVWLGLDHNWGEGPPLIFETMIFGTDDAQEYQWRYSTEAEAQAAHDRIVAQLESGTPLAEVGP